MNGTIPNRSRLPTPKIEPLTGEYEFLIHFAANLGRTKSSTSEAAKCFMRLNFPKLSKPGSPAKIGASHRLGDDGTRFMNFNLHVEKQVLLV